MLIDRCSIVTDGVVLIDPDYVKDRKVFGHVLAAFKYGREDLDVLGLTFRKDLYLDAEQIYPVVPGAKQRKLTRLQEKLIKKLGSNAYPFYFELPPHCPASVTLQPAPCETGKPCGVDYELKAFVGETLDDKPQKRYEPRLSRSSGERLRPRDFSTLASKSIFSRHGTDRRRARFFYPFCGGTFQQTRISCKYVSQCIICGCFLTMKIDIRTFSKKLIHC